MMRTLLSAWAILWALSAGCFPPVDQPEDVDSAAADTANGSDTAALEDTATPPDTGDEDTAADTTQGHPCVGGCAPSTTPCKVSQCDTTTGECVERDATDGVECSDGLVCTVGDRCIGGQCLSAQNGCDDGIACTADSCDEGLGGCVHDGGACECGPGVSCDDKNPCNGVETCDLATYTCAAGAAPPENVPCDDGLACTEDDRCRSQECKGVALNCADGLPCSVDSCDEAFGGCVSDKGACACTGDVDCPDANLCDGKAFCDTGANACAPGTPVTCEAPTNECKRTSCVPATGGCAVFDKDNGTSCDDGSVCTTTDTCQAGVCTGFAPVTCTPSNSCHETAGCDPTLGCLESPKPDGTPCQTPNAEDGSCKTGTCKRLPIVVAGGSHTCAILSDGGLKCWGWNIYGELGQGNTDDNGGTPVTPFAVKNIPPVLTSVVGVGVGDGITCAAMMSGDVRCWGNNTLEDLGYGDSLPRGGSPDTIPSVLPPIPLGASVATITSQGYRSCVRTSAGGVRCWGDGYDYPPLDEATVGTEWGPSIAEAGDIALDPVRSVAIVVNTNFGSSCVLFDDHRIRCWGSNGPLVGSVTATTYGYGSDPPQDAPVINPEWDAIAISAGSAHVCAVAAGGTVHCWGYNNTYQLGLGDTESRSVPTHVSSPVSFTMIAAGGNHTCGLTSQGAVRCWGGGAFGQCGTGSTASVTSVPSADLQLGGPAARITSGWGYTCAVLRNGEVRCWGTNDHRQLGVPGPQMNAIGDDPGEMPPPAVDLD